MAGFSFWPLRQKTSQPAPPLLSSPPLPSTSTPPHSPSPKQEEEEDFPPPPPPPSDTNPFDPPPQGMTGMNLRRAYNAADMLKAKGRALVWKAKALHLKAAYTTEVLYLEEAIANESFVRSSKMDDPQEKLLRELWEIRALEQEIDILEKATYLLHRLEEEKKFIGSGSALKKAQRSADIDLSRHPSHTIFKGFEEMETDSGDGGGSFSLEPGLR